MDKERICERLWTALILADIIAEVRAALCALCALCVLAGGALAEVEAVAVLTVALAVVALP